MDINLLPSRIEDLKQQCGKTSAPKFLGFLTASELAVALNCLKNCSGYAFCGGYDGAERTVLAFLPDWCEQPQYPISAFTFTYRACDSLTHRDFLGALMALGIARETVGDILVGEGKAVVFVLSDVAKFVLTQIDKIGNVGVKITQGFSEPLPQNSKKQSFTTTVASTRLDCVVSALCGISRKEASNKISDGFVAVNSVCILKPTANVSADSKVAVRQSGKFEITSCDEYSKKGRIILKYNKYV